MDKLIKKFREVVNQDNFVLEKYRNNDDKDKWSCICSCMDWIDVSVEYIKKNKKRIENKQYFDMEIFAYISSIAIVSEAIKQLHRVFYNTTKTPFEKDHSIFNNSEKSDDEYFAHIRACFGAHPTNLTPSKNEKNFASYPTKNLDINYFSVILYSNKIDEWGNVFTLPFDKLEEYFKKRYFYLKQLIEETEKNKKIYIKSLKDKIIKKDKCLKKQVLILLEESKQRLNLDYHVYIAETILNLIDFKITNTTNIPIIIKYLKILRKFIITFYNKLQTMNLEDCDDIFVNIYSNSYSKILENNYIDFDILEVKELLKEFVTIESNMTYREIRSLCQIGMYFLYHKNKMNKKDVNKTENNIIIFLDDLENEIYKIDLK